jgi:dephospho-CoA kinase
MTVEKLDAILARQMPQEEKAKLADFIIDTGTTLPETRAQVGRIVAQCREMLYAQPK